MKKITLSDIFALKASGRKFSVITCYDYSTAAFIADTAVDIVLVGDSAAQVMLGEPNTLPATMDYMVLITKAVRRGCGNKLIVADMPFLSYQPSIKDAILNAGRFVTEAGADIIKIEVGDKQAAIVEAVSDAGMAVMAHIGMRPQSVGLTGRLRAEGTTAKDASHTLDVARRMQDAGAKMLLIEGVARETAKLVTENIDLPVIGCGAGPDCDGQVLVISDVLGLNRGFMPKFAKKYASIGETITAAINEYVCEVENSRFPQDEQSYHIKPEEKNNPPFTTI